jgi:hypothetical protein
MVKITALKEVSYEIPKGPTTALRSVLLAPGGVDSMSFLEYLSMASALAALAANGLISYEAPLGNGWGDWRGRCHG